MRMRLTLTALCLCLWIMPGLQAAAVDTPVTVDQAELSRELIDSETEEEVPPAEEPGEPPAEEPAPSEPPAEAPAESPPPVQEPEYTGPKILVDGVSLGSRAEARAINNTMYISLRAGVEAVYPNAEIGWADGGAQVQAEGLSITAVPGKNYLIANGRYLYVPDHIRLDSGVTLVPVRVLARALGASVTWDAETGSILLSSGNGPIESGDTFYRSDAVYWLSRIINAESGNQPMNGKVGVGSVILNRVASPLFPNTIYDVIFDARGGSYQFSPARSGVIHREPNAESTIAAKLCLDGAREAGGSLYFNAVGLSCWASRNRTLVTTIGNHSFYE